MKRPKEAQRVAQTDTGIQHQILMELAGVVGSPLNLSTSPGVALASLANLLALVCRYTLRTAADARDLIEVGYRLVPLTALAEFSAKYPPPQPPPPRLG